VNELLDFRKLELNKIGVRATSDLTLVNWAKEVGKHSSKGRARLKKHTSYLDSDADI